MARECWQDGRLLCHYQAHLYFLEKWTVPRELYFFGANIGTWKTGQIVGDKNAMALVKLKEVTA